MSPRPVTADPDTTRPADAVEVARVLGAWGVKGALRLKPFSADPQALFSSKRWWIEPGEARPGPAPRPAGVATAASRAVAPAAAAVALPPQPRRLRVVQAREQGDTVVATVEDIADRDAAQALAGWRVFVPRSSFPTPEADEFYWIDLIGLQVVNRDGADLGRVEGLIETGPHCVLRLHAAGEGGELRERLIPFVAAYVDAVDLRGRRITVDWDPED